MSKPAWAAVFAAIAMPSIALLIVLLSRPEPRPPDPASQALHVPRPPMPPLALDEDSLMRMKKTLALTDEQIDEIWKISEPAHRRLTELDAEIHDQELALRDLLQSDPAEKDVLVALDELDELHAERRRLRVITPLKLENLLTDEQVEKLKKHPPPQKMGPPPGPYPPLPHPPELPGPPPGEPPPHAH